jgi:RNA polymerase-interacting CarD/CdnL/TRCF family regulator
VIAWRGRIAGRPVKFRIGEKVVYPSQGVSVVEEITTDFCGEILQRIRTT